VIFYLYVLEKPQWKMDFHFETSEKIDSSNLVPWKQKNHTTLYQLWVQNCSEMFRYWLQSMWLEHSWWLSFFFLRANHKLTQQETHRKVVSTIWRDLWCWGKDDWRNKNNSNLTYVDSLEVEFWNEWNKKLVKNIWSEIIWGLEWIGIEWVMP